MRIHNKPVYVMPFAAKVSKNQTIQNTAILQLSRRIALTNKLYRQLSIVLIMSREFESNRLNLFYLSRDGSLADYISELSLHMQIDRATFHSHRRMIDDIDYSRLSARDICEQNLIRKETLRYARLYLLFALYFLPFIII